MNIFAIDPSLTASGWCRINDNTVIIDKRLRGLSGVFKTKTNGIKRLSDIRNYFKAQLLHDRPDYVFIEDYAYGGRGQDMGEVGGILRLLFYDLKIPYFTVVPQHLKKFTCGTGGAKKELMLVKCLSRFGVEFHDNNECDAFCLAQFGYEMISIGYEEFFKKYKLNGEKKIVQYKIIMEGIRNDKRS